MKTKAIIIGGGTPPTKKLLKQEITNDSIIIAADSGANCLWHYKIMPHYLIGDFDSINSKPLKDLKIFKGNRIQIISYPTDKNATDAELALEKATELKVKQIVFLGCTGGKRNDHFLGALGLLATCLDLNISASLKDDYQEIILVKKSITIYGNLDDQFSLQAYGGPVKNLSITGAKYQLKNYLLKMGDALTLANEFQKKKVMIKFSTGKLLIITNMPVKF